MSASRKLLALLACAGFLAGGRAGAFELPAVCAGAAKPPADAGTAPIPELRRRVEAESETDPTAAVSLLCAALPRVAKEYGEQSPELGWWVKSLTMPMIAYMDRFAEALPLLAFAQPLLERAYGPQGEELADIHVAYAWVYHRQGKDADAVRAWERALAIRERYPGARKVELQKALVGLALAKLSLGELRDARTAIERAHAIVVEYHEEVSEASAAIENVMTNLAFREENFREAKRHAQAQIAIERQLQAGIGQLVPGYVFLGQILERLDDFAGSEAASREAIRLAEADHGGPLQRHHLTALTQLARLLDARDRPREALPLARRAVALGERTLGPNAPHLVRTLQALADAYRALGELPEAWHIYQRIGTIVAASGSDVERPVLVAYYRGLAGLEIELGNLDDAAAALDEGLEATRTEPTLVLQRAYLMATLAQITSRSDAQASRAQLAEARRLFEARLPATHPAILRVVSQSCALEIATHASPRSCREARRRLAARGEIEPSLRAALYGNLSRLSEAQGRLDAAARYAESAVAAAEGLGMPEPLWRAYFRAAAVLKARGRQELAIFFGKRAIAQIEREREQFTGEDERFDRSFLRDRSDVYRSVADWLLEAGRIDEAIEVMQLLKAQELAEFVSRAAPVGVPGTGPELSPIERQLERLYSGALPAGGASSGAEIDRLSRMQDRDRITASERARLAALARVEREREADTARRIHAFLESNGARPSSAPPARPVQAARLRVQIDHAPAHTAIAYYLLTQRGLRILIATHATQTDVSLPLDARQLQVSIGRFLDEITRRADVSTAARGLYDILARPLDAIARRERVTRLELWLDGPLRYIPFGALLAPDGYLAERYAIQIVEHGEARSHGSAEEHVQRPMVRGFGVTMAVAGFPALPAMADELCYVVRGPIAGLATRSPACAAPGDGRGALEGEGFADRAFTARRLELLLRAPHAFSVLHLGTHFSLRPGNIDRSFLVLGDGSRLMLDTLSTLDFSGLDVVTMSACQTAVGGARTDDGREIDGLNAIVQQRGARHVVASLWQVEDSSTAELMRAFYDRLADPSVDPAEALRDAQRTVRELTVNGRRAYSHPYYWAGFIVSGS